ncbi:MAG: hypothetical protein IKM08_01875 [Clostridia bacterium]|nr:hypothetical protein [Clostridia bacterium]
MALKDVNLYDLTPEQLAQSKELTKKKMNMHKLLALIFLLCGGIGLFLPFGKMAQLYTIGYAQLNGKRTNASGWAFAGFFMSWLMAVVLSKVFSSLNTPRFILPPDYVG